MKKLLQYVMLTAALPAFGWNVGTEVTKRSAVLEEYTGIHCPNCPDGHRMAAELARNHPDEVFVVSIHAGSFATPKYGELNYITTEGQAIHDRYDISGYPSGVISRRDNGFGVNISRSLWGSSAREVTAKDSPVNLYAACTYDAATRGLTVNIEGYYTADMTDPRLTVFLMQNNILGPQDGGKRGVEYPHRHMLRDVLTENVFGDAIDVKTAGQYFSKDIKVTLPADIDGVKLEPYDIEIMAFVAEGEGEIVKAARCFPQVEAEATAPRIFDCTLPSIPIGSNYALDYLEMAVDNYSGDALTSASFDFTLNDKPYKLEWTGSVPAHEHATIQIPLDGAIKTVFDNDDNKYSIKCRAFNGKDPALETSTYKGKFSKLFSYPSELTFKIKTDVDAADNTYRIIDEQGNTVKEFGPYPNGEDKVYEESVSLEPGKVYGLEIADKWGDGIFRPRGSVKIYGPGSALVGQLMEIDNYGLRTFFTAYDAASAADITAAATVVSEEYYDLSGRRLAAGARGLGICRRVMSDGTVTVTKTNK